MYEPSLPDIANLDMGSPSLTEIASKFQIRSVITLEQEKEIIALLFIEKPPELVFAVELMSFVMQENGQRYENTMYFRSSKDPHPFPIDDLMKKLVRIIMEKNRSKVETVVKKGCNMEQPTYAEFRNYAISASLAQEALMLQRSHEFLTISVMLALMCTIAFMHGLSEAPNLGIILICRNHWNHCLFFNPNLWDNLKALAQKAIVVIEAKTVDEKGSKVNDSSTVSNETESQVSKSSDTRPENMKLQPSTSRDYKMIHKRQLPKSQELTLWKCPYCSGLASMEKTIIHHMRMHNQLPSVDKCLLSPASTIAKYCDCCGLKFLSNETYKDHKEIYCKAGGIHKNRLRTFLPYPNAQQPQIQQPTGNVAASTETVIIANKTSYDVRSTDQIISTPLDLSLKKFDQAGAPNPEQ